MNIPKIQTEDTTMNYLVICTTAATLEYWPNLCTPQTFPCVFIIYRKCLQLGVALGGESDPFPHFLLYKGMEHSTGTQRDPLKHVAGVRMRGAVATLNYFS